MAHISLRGLGGYSKTPNIDHAKYGWFRFANFFNYEMNYKINHLKSIRRSF